MAKSLTSVLQNVELFFRACSVTVLCAKAGSFCLGGRTWCAGVVPPAPFAVSRAEGKDLKSGMTTAPPSGRSFSASVCWYSSPRPRGILRNTTPLHFYRGEKGSFYA